MDSGLRILESNLVPLGVDNLNSNRPSLFTILTNLFFPSFLSLLCLQQDIMIANGGTVVLATHQTELFPLSDLLCVMNNGHQAYCGKYNFKAVKPYFPTLVEEAAVSGKKKNDVAHTPAEKLSSEQQTLVTNKRSSKSRELKPKLSMPLDEVIPSDKAVKKEQNIYSWYFARMGYNMIAIATLIFVIGQILRVLQ